MWNEERNMEKDVEEGEEKKIDNIFRCHSFACSVDASELKNKINRVKTGKAVMYFASAVVRHSIHQSLNI